MKKTAFVLGYAGSILAIVFSMLMILTVPLALAGDMLDDITNELKSEHVLALNNTAIELGEQNWTDYSKDGLRQVAETAAEQYGGDPDVYDKAAQFAYKKGVEAMISMIVVAAAIVLAVISLIGALIVKKAPTAGGVLLLLTAFFLLLAAIYTNTLSPMFIATVLLALGGIAIFIPARMNRAAPASAYTAPQGYQPAAPPYAPPQGYQPAAPPYAPPQGYAPPQACQEEPCAPVGAEEGASAAPAEGSGLPFPEDDTKPDNGTV